MMPRRQGTTLAEVVAAMGANAVLAGVAAVALASLGRADREVNALLDDRAAFSRFAEQLRDDVHAADKLTWDAQKRVLSLSREGTAIEFRRDKSNWARYAAPSGAAEAELSAVFKLPPRLRVEWQPANAETGDVVRIRFREADEPANGPRRLMSEELIIKVGRDARLLHE